MRSASARLPERSTSGGLFPCGWRRWALPCLLAVWFLAPPLLSRAANELALPGARQEFAERWETAAEAYRAKDYERAREIYEGLLVAVPGKDRPHPDLCYNLGNTYYQLGQSGLAAWMYERALAEAPRHGDARQNLSLLRATLATPEPDAEPFFLFKPVVLLEGFLTAGEWAALFALLYVATAALATVWILARNARTLSRLARAATIAGFCLSLIAGVFLASSYYDTEHRRYAVVVEPDATVRAGPGPEEEAYFEAREGERFLVREAGITNWLKVTRRSDGRTGYLPENALRIIQGSPERIPAPRAEGV